MRQPILRVKAESILSGCGILRVLIKMNEASRTFRLLQCLAEVNFQTKEDGIEAAESVMSE